MNDLKAKTHFQEIIERPDPKTPWLWSWKTKVACPYCGKMIGGNPENPHFNPDLDACPYCGLIR